MTIRFSALETDIVRGLQSGGLDANDQPPERGVSPGSLTPCRHCLTQVDEGKAILILSHRPFPSPQPYAEQGPIFLHAEPCPPYIPGSDIPDMLDSPRYLIRGYNNQNRIVYGTGRIASTAEISDSAEEMFSDQSVSYIHVRSASNNCYLCRIDRA